MPQRTSLSLPGLSRRTRVALTALSILLVLLVTVPRVNAVYVDWLWYGSVDARSVFVTNILARTAVFLVVAVVVGLAMFFSAFVAFRSRPVFMAGLSPNDPLARYRGLITSRVRFFGIVLPLAVGVLAGLLAQTQWQVALLWLHREPFGITDPEFGIDLGFYAFTLPFLRLIVDWLMVTVVLAFVIGLVGHYVFGGIRLAEPGRRGSVTVAARTQLAVLAGLFLLLKAVSYWFDRYELMYKDNSTFTGAGYTDVNALLPAKLILLVIAAICAVTFFASVFLRDLRVPALATVLMLVSSIVIGWAWPLFLEQFSVKPNRAAKEEQYIARNIEATRVAYGLTDENVKYERNWGGGASDPAEMARDTATLSNLRILDPAIISDTFTQQQQLKNFYGFPSALNVDRYPTGPNGTPEAYIVAARELNPRTLTGNQQDWINRHTVYTHGNGFIAAPANRVDSVARDTNAGGGSPKYIVADLQALQRAEQDPEAERLRIQVDQPRIYFGPVIANTDADYAIVGGAGAREYDGDGQTYTYTGSGGVSIGNWLNRLSFATHYGEPKIVLSGDIGGDSRIVFDRDPRDRVQRVAPWLTTDSAVYPIVVDGRVKWVVDGYTTLDNLPYSQHTSLEATTKDSLAAGGQRTQAPRQVGYIRNSVKAVVDAYDGSVTLYAWDEQDPVLKAWRGVYPDVVKPRGDMSQELVSHVRYPEDLFKVQRTLLSKYHVGDARVFFANDSFWSVPNDPSGSGGSTALPQPPFYVVASDPRQQGKATFQQISALQVLNRDFLAAQVSVNSDPDGYGQITVRALPTDTQTPGPKLVQDTLVSSDEIARSRTQLSGQALIRDGNLLTMAVGKNSVLYVEPMYTQIKDTDAAFPKLLRVMIYYRPNGEENPRIGYAPTVADALQQVGIRPQVVAPGQESGGTTPSGPSGPQPGGNQPTPGGQAGQPGTSAPSGPVDARARDEAAGRIDRAIADLKRAQRDGDFAAQGRALEALDRAVADYQRANGQTSAGRN